MVTNQSVTMTTTSSSTREEVRIVAFDLNYLKTLPGILKCLELILGFIALICIISVKIFGGMSRKTYFIVVSSGGLIITGILLIFYIFHVIQRLITIPWLMVFFGFCTTIVYLFDAFTKVRSVRVTRQAAI
ncbi:hypothetical protein B566_EDAN002425 [Ephemera danica]|nr:hypothetical protein B566_EDAN002425 [Ephemera danica]